MVPPEDGRARYSMKNGLFRFYFLFILLSMGLFSCENRVIGHDGKMLRKVLEEEQMKKEMAKPKRPFKHYSRSANLCWSN